MILRLFSRVLIKKILQTLTDLLFHNRHKNISRLWWEQTAVFAEADPVVHTIGILAGIRTVVRKSQLKIMRKKGAHGENYRDLL